MLVCNVVAHEGQRERHGPQALPATNDRHMEIRGSVNEALQRHGTMVAASLTQLLDQQLPMADQPRQAARSTALEQHEQDQRVQTRLIASVLAILNTSVADRPITPPTDADIDRVWEAAGRIMQQEIELWGPLVIKPLYPTTQARFA